MDVAETQSYFYFFLRKKPDLIVIQKKKPDLIKEEI